jgi:hypothetical protein
LLRMRIPLSSYRTTSSPGRQFPVEALQNVERLLPFTFVRDETLSVESALNSGKLPDRRPKIIQNPWLQPTSEWQLSNRCDLILVQVLLELLGPTITCQSPFSERVTVRRALQAAAAPGPLELPMAARRPAARRLSGSSNGHNTRRRYNYDRRAHLRESIITSRPSHTRTTNGLPTGNASGGFGPGKIRLS